MGIKLKNRRRKPGWKKRAERGMRGFPVVSIGWYGPHADHASKVVAGVIAEKGAEPDPMFTRTHDSEDVRHSAAVNDELQAFIDENRVRSVVTSGRIIGCPHESGSDYTEEYCPDPACSFWMGRDRWAR